MLIATLIIGAFNAGIAKADAKKGGNGLIYTNRSIIHAIHGSPNPVVDRMVKGARIVYVDKANGPAIYSYPSQVAHQSVEFNVQYIDTAHGPAIYSYPGHTNQHRLELVDKANEPVTPVITAISTGTSMFSIR